MSNAKNLKRGNPATQFKPGEEAVKAGRKGGIASGRVRGFRAAIKQRIKEHPELVDEIIDKLISLFKDDGDLQALGMLVELLGESSREREIDIKSRELDLKKEIADNSNW